MKVAAIVPALNEEKNVGAVLKVLLSSEDIDEVILVDDGSVDHTALIGRKAGAKIVSLPQKGGSGKGNAMREGAKATRAEILVFFDADLVGLKKEHVSLLVKPVLEGEVVMCVGVRERQWWGKISELSIKIDPLTAIAGERAVKRYVFESIPFDFIRGFMVETALNYFCLANKLPVKYVKLRELDIVIKEKKWGLIKGFSGRLKMIWQLIKIRAIILKRRKEFIIKNVQKDPS